MKGYVYSEYQYDGQSDDMDVVLAEVLSQIVEDQLMGV